MRNREIGMRKFFSVIVIAALVVSLSVVALASTGGFGNFAYSGDYYAGQFNDVRETDWYARYVEDAFNYGFFRGKSESEFAPDGLLTFGEAVTLAARVRSIYFTGKAEFAGSVPFYAVYADYAREHGVIDQFGVYDFEAPAARAQLAQLVHNALPAEAFAEINVITDYGISDVVHGEDHSSAVYALYRAGILTGADSFGTFSPGSNITRAETSAIMVRLAAPAARVRTALPSKIPAETIFLRSTDAVFMIETFDSNGDSIRTGSGFFISSEGLAATALHVFDNAANATITFRDGRTYDVRGIHAVCSENNLAIFSIDSGDGGWSYLRLADSDIIEAGETVYVIGSPLSLIGTITEGIIANTHRLVDGSSMIQFSAPISFGSGGSPLLNSLGQVIGVASSSFSYGQNLNLAIPVNFLKELEPGEYVTLASLL